ncbi:MAG: non-canonical purine NTP pyrophosphatase [Gemmatimonadaceae bacterium]|nr:non-canonical purine NTP pyrophosphatase [Gemmatimonadaceae bacterium]
MLNEGGRPCIVATRSAGKVRELLPLLLQHGWQPMTLADAGIPFHADEDTLEVFAQFEENALAKAQYFAARTTLPVFADDSGLCVEALDAGPGVRSKRWSGRDDLEGQALDDANNALLLSELARRGALTPERRRASYVCAAVCVSSTGVSVVARGETAGHLLLSPSGSQGFGYDPLFFSDELGVTFASVSTSEKAVVSHRGRAFTALLLLMSSTSST